MSQATQQRMSKSRKARRDGQRFVFHVSIDDRAATCRAVARMDAVHRAASFCTTTIAAIDCYLLSSSRLRRKPQHTSSQYPLHRWFIGGARHSTIQQRLSLGTT
ncbi:hypothetical protein [Paraburkholderia flava]|uniref:hypothetical protein n=1 Tax=Paraburkholderia flava TaxID=2547393 RepID=UPI00105EA3CD|nr:hypothetical protein [Paraburkholderia flava]